MSQHDLVIDNGVGATVRADINAALQALASTSKGSARPPTIYAGQLWLKDASTPWELYLFDGGDDIFIGKVNAGTNTIIWDWDKATDIAAAATTDIGAATGNFATVTGTTTITALGTIKAGTLRIMHFSGAPILTHNATSLILPGGANIPTRAGDVAIFISLGSGNWRCASYLPADGGSAAVKSDMGQCLLLKSGGNLKLEHCDGRTLFIDGRFEIIPVTGVSLSATGLSVGVTYNIYAYMNAGTMTLEAATTGYGRDPTYGHLNKGTDPTRSLVGMARTIAGPAWADTNIQRFVRSYYNDRGISLDYLSTTASTASTTSTELASSERAEFLSWFDERVVLAVAGSFSNNTAGASCVTRMNLDGVVRGPTATGHSAVANYKLPFAIATSVLLGEGYHSLSVNGHVSAGTGTWENFEKTVFGNGSPV